ncbi:MAG: hypothetical protein FWG29_07810 [Treponema sp.]|nr:hypothetical protein [Treponema sp.]
MKRISDNHQKWRVFHFTFTSGKKRRTVSVASTNTEEAQTLILAMFDDVSALREKRRAA